ncbi:endolytic transglycosylase MltG [Streptomyces tsukubensis]|uniref:Endolytic murein transglycosylase n=1 Tax=Streptomyces tsukubensis TaxID=83656 RepID=A0A1V4A166_9ACTN|nr:endolytic transglycosylase MltG [Streptomyces tsukubensis]OON72441.1 aminodeoxychorismate lyase [Streptomyces tsukubensis]QFR96972.1 endolytic transglycosylase MltG [Streptomyces tsukubensis]
MLKNTPRGSRLRLTRRGRTVLTVAAAAAAATVVVVVVLLPDDSESGPRSLTVPEGRRAGQVYESVDKALGLSPGTTKGHVTKAGLKLPGEAGGDPEGYLFPATYPLNDKSTPESVLSYMVNTANERLTGGNVTAGADRNAVSVYQTVTVASIVQAEADSAKDMSRVARVIYNRLDQGMPLQMDSTINYALKRSTLDTTHHDTRTNSPYNTYAKKGLPPTPITNPGEDAIRAATKPATGDWLYFVTVKPGDTRFTGRYDEHQKHVAEFNRLRRSASPDG